MHFSKKYNNKLKKEQARDTISNFLKDEKPKLSREYDLGVRINSFDTPYWEDDLKSCLDQPHLPDTILVPKVESTEHIKLVSCSVTLVLKFYVVFKTLFLVF